MKLSNHDRQRLEALKEALGELQSDLSLAQVMTLLSVALEPGISVNNLAERLDVPQQTASRHVAVLLGRYQGTLSSSPPEPLLTQGVNEQDPRKRALFLNERGEEVVASMVAARPPRK